MLKDAVRIYQTVHLYQHYNPERGYVGPWFLVDSTSAEPDVNYPGEFISEHETKDQATEALVKLIVEAGKQGEQSK